MARRAGRGVGRALRAVRRRLGWTSPAEVVPLVGWTSPDHTTVLARVREAHTDHHSLEGAVTRLGRALGVTTVPDIEAELCIDGARVRTLSDDQGLLRWRLSGGTCDRATVRLVGSQAVAPVRLHRSGEADHLVISDVDDTILETSLERPLRRARQLLFRSSSPRLPFDGVGPLLRRLASAGWPVFYLSNSAWAIREPMLELFMDHDLPPGPLVLRPWGLAPDGSLVPFAKGGAHKRRFLQQIVADHPHASAVLIGDTSREDGALYLELAETHPGAVAAIYLRRVEGRLAREPDFEALEAKARALGVPLRVVDSAAEVSCDLVARGLLSAPLREAS